MVKTHALSLGLLGLSFAACSSDFTAASDAGGGSAGARAGATSDPEAGAVDEGGAAGSVAAAGDSSQAGGEPGGGEANGGAPAGGASGGTGGLVNIGGLVNSAGAPPVFTSAKLIDNMEDGNSTLLDTNGDWYVFTDKSMGAIDPALMAVFKMTAVTPAHLGSKEAVHVKVSNFTGWGAAFGFDFGYIAGKRQPYDLLDYSAVRFWTKASKYTEVVFQAPNADTDSLGGKCSGDGGNACSAHFSKGFFPTAEWRQVAILFSELKQSGTGHMAAAFDPHHVYSMFFVIPPDQTNEVWVDDIELVK